MPKWQRGFPRYWRDTNNYPIMFEVLTRDGGIARAVVDASMQYRAEGLRWVNADTRETIRGQLFIQGWREINSEKIGE